MQTDAHIYRQIETGVQKVHDIRPTTGNRQTADRQTDNLNTKALNKCISV